DRAEHTIELPAQQPLQLREGMRTIGTIWTVAQMCHAVRPGFAVDRRNQCKIVQRRRQTAPIRGLCMVHHDTLQVVSCEPSSFYITERSVSRFSHGLLLNFSADSKHFIRIV